jgi:hypothetical protein
LASTFGVGDAVGELLNGLIQAGGTRHCEGVDAIFLNIRTGHAILSVQAAHSWRFRA